ncbi:10795_t:CDS:2, partial [Paraglomus occultum]
GIQYLHEKKIAHLDLKPSHIAFLEGKLRFLDFDSAIFFNDDQGSYHIQTEGDEIGTPGYNAPETQKKGTFNPFAADIWSLGQVFRYFHSQCHGYGVILNGQRIAEKSRAFVLTFVRCIEDKQQQDLFFKLLHNEDSCFNSTASSINYARYLEELMDDYLIAVVSEALGTDTCTDEAHSLTEALLRHCSLTAVRIKKLTITRSYELNRITCLEPTLRQ